jgi:hypothetical protein
MAKYTVTISDAKDLALDAVAKRDGKTKEQIIQAQVDYYVGVVLGDYAFSKNGLTDAEYAELKTQYVNVKATFVAAKEERVEPK